MDEERLIEEIVREVKVRIKSEEGLGKRQTALVIGRLSQKDRKVLEADFKLVSLEEDMQFRLVILAQTSIRLLAELAHGMPISQEGQVILRALMEGHGVCFLEEGMTYRDYRGSASQPLMLLFREYEDAICRFGAQGIRNAADICDWAEKRQQSCPGNKVPCEKIGFQTDQEQITGKEPANIRDYTSRKLLQESDLIRARGAGVRNVLLDADAILTPLAADYAANHGLLLIRKGETG